MSTTTTCGPLTPRNIELSFQMTKHATANIVDGFRFTCEVLSACHMPTKIFRYERQPGPSVVFPVTDVFNGIASPADLEEYPDDQPNANQHPQFFLLDTVDIIFRSTNEGMEAFEAIKEDVARLIRSLNYLDDLENPIDVVITG